MPNMKKTTFFFSLLIIISLNLISSCKKEDDKQIQIPVLTTVDVSNITSSTVTSGGDISFDGGAEVTSRGVCWSLSENPTTEDSKTNDGNGTGSFSSTISGLSTNTTYYVRAYATNLEGTAYGNQISFQTSAELPVITTTEVTDVTTTTATSGGNITSDGGSSVTARGVCWNTDSTPTIENSKTTEGTGTGAFTSTISGLTANTTYYLRSYATNSSGTVYGNEISFTTIPAMSAQFKVLKVFDGKEIRSIIKTSDGGYIAIANSEDYDVLKFDSNFNLVWNKTYGGTQVDRAESIIQTNDGGYLVVGKSKSSDGDVSVNHGGNDIWACKLDPDGNLSWQNSYGGSGSETLNGENAVLQTGDGGYLIAGNTTSSDGDISNNHGGYDAWLVKINSTGTIDFEKTIGGSSDDFGRKIIETNADYTLLVQTSSSDGDFSEPGNWLVQTNSSGNIVWKTNLNGSSSGSISNTSDGGIVAINATLTNFTLHKVDSNGDIVLAKTISFQDTLPKQPSSKKIIQTEDKGFMIIGSLGNGSDADALLFRVNPDFNIIYYKIYEGNNIDISASLLSLGSNQYIYQFYTGSSDITNITHSSWLASAIVKVEETNY